MAKITPLFFGRVKGGKLSLEKADKFREFLSTLDGKEIALSVRKAEYTRSGAENRYYWGVVVRMVADEMAILPDEAHDFLKSLFLKEGVEVGGKRFEIVKSSADLSIADFEDYCEKCRNWAGSELGIKVPLPNEIDQEF
jgi:hypothetical protein